jgi:hypothetical protein
MRARGHKAAAVEDGAPPNGKALASNPLDGDEVLARFYGATPEPPPTTAKKQKPTHYKLVCISLYTEDIQLLESLVAELKRRGHTKANKSQVIRAALDQIDLDRIPKGY